MSNNNLLDSCLAILYHIKDDNESLETLLNYMKGEFLSETQDDDIVQLTDYKLQIDEEYRPVVKEIAEYLEMGHIVFINPDTLEVVNISKDYDQLVTGIEYDYDKVEDWIEIEPLESHESHKIMESFIKSLPKGREREILANAIDGHKPFANFNRLIHNSEERENWFIYRTYWFEKHVIDNYLTKIIMQNK